MEHMVYQKTRTQSLADVRALNMWGFELDNISIVSGMTNAETLAFPVNQISTLLPFASCKNLRNMLLRGNQISDFKELDHLRDLHQLTTLSLSDNPVAQDPEYRDIVLQKLPQLKKLDDIECDVNTRVPQREIATAVSARNRRESLPPKARAVPQSVPRQVDRIKPKQTADAHMLSAILSLIPELSRDSLEVVLQAVQARCR
jgi:Leucine-rich repeat (LRR) protein